MGDNQIRSTLGQAPSLSESTATAYDMPASNLRRAVHPIRAHSTIISHPPLSPQEYRCHPQIQYSRNQYNSKREFVRRDAWCSPPEKLKIQ
ncbi:hypothetical protein L218DRAFT_953058 [Marasmius fiardii PR-910]|nr:hypothetical protein L218DRAFT_953058 [Marasmius fiardii PR-910]